MKGVAGQNRGGKTDDCVVVGNWFSRFTRRLTGGSAATVDVRRMLREAQRSRARVELEGLRRSSKLGQRLVTTIEQVTDDEFVISQPTVGGTVRLVARYEPYRMTVAGARGRVAGETRSLGRTKIASGGRGMLFGYRMAIPREFFVIDRRQELRMLFGNDLVFEAAVQLLGREGPLLGLVEDLSPHGACLRCRNAGAFVRRGQQGHISMDLPEPAGEVRETVTIAALEATETDEAMLVRVTFHKKNAAIAHALRIARSAFKPRGQGSAKKSGSVVESEREAA